METTVTRKISMSVAPYETVMNSSVIAVMEKARNHLKRAKDEGLNPNDTSANKHRNDLITTISTLRDMTKTLGMSDGPENISELFSYMIDRLSIRHSSIDIHPLTEVGWLLESLKNVFENPGSYRKH